MAQSPQLINTLKKALKAHGKTYQDVAKALALTESSVKRLFSEQNLSLQRLDLICQLISMEISDVVKLMDASNVQLQQLSPEQEAEIANDLELLLVTVCVLNHWEMSDITGFYNINDTDCLRKLAKLDRLKIIDLLPKNRIKLLVASNFSWRENGPIQRFFHQNIEQEFFNTGFKKQAEQLLVINGMLSDSSNVIFQKKMARLARDFDELNNDDSKMALKQRHGCTVVLAMRGWNYGLFSHLVRK